VAAACKTEGVRVSECRAAFFAELEMLGRTNQNFQHTNCTLYSKLECCLVTEYGIQGCLDKGVITKAITNAVREHQNYDNCPKGLCDPSSMNGSFKIMRDMDENLHGRESVSRLLSAHRRKVKREVDPHLESHLPEGAKEAKSYVEEHLKSSKHKNKRKINKRSHKGNKIKNHTLPGDELARDQSDQGHAKSDGDVQVITPKTFANNTEIFGSIDNSSHSNTTGGSSVQSKVEVALNTSKGLVPDIKTGFSAAIEKDAGSTVTSGLDNDKAAQQKHNLVEVKTNASVNDQPISPASISIEVMKKNVSLSELGRKSRKNHRRRRHRRGKNATKVAQDKSHSVKPSTVGDGVVLAQNSSNATNASPAQMHGVSGSNHGNAQKVDDESKGKVADLDNLGNKKIKKNNISRLDHTGTASEKDSSKPNLNETKKHLKQGPLHNAINGTRPASNADTAVPNNTKNPVQNGVPVDGEPKLNGHFDTALKNKSTAGEKKVDEAGPSLDAISKANGVGKAMKSPLGDGKTKKGALSEKEPKGEKELIGSIISGANSSKLKRSGDKDKSVNSSAVQKSESKRDNSSSTISGEMNNHNAEGTITSSKNKHSDSAPKIKTPISVEDNTLVEIRGNLSLVEKGDDIKPVLYLKSDDVGKKTSGLSKSAPSGDPAIGAPILHDEVPDISLAVHVLDKKRDESFLDGDALVPKSASNIVPKNEIKSGKRMNESGVQSPGGVSDLAENKNRSAKSSLKLNVSNGASGPSDTTDVHLKDPKQVFGSGPLIEVRGGNKGGTFEKQMVHSYETGVGERLHGSRVRDSLVDDLMDQYVNGASDYNFHYGRDSRKDHKQRFRDDDDAPKVRRRQSDGDEPFETDTTKDPFQEYPNAKDGDTRTGGLYVADLGRRLPADENVKVARHKKVHHRKPDNDYNYESVVRWKLLEELDSILDPRNSANVETLNKPLNTEFGREKDDDMDQWKRRLEPANVHVEAQSGERIVSSHDDTFRDTDAMRDGDMYYRKYRRQGPMAFGTGYEGRERPIIKDPIIHQPKRRFWIERQLSSNASSISSPAAPVADRYSSADIHLKPLPRVDGTVLAENTASASGDKPAIISGRVTSNETALETRNPYGAPSVGRRVALEREDYSRRLTNRRAVRLRRLRGSRGARKLHKSLKDTEGLKILRNDDLQGDDDDDEDDDADDDDDDEDDEELKDVASVKRSTAGIVTQKAQVGRVDAAERPLMSFGERIRTNEPTRATSKKDFKPSGSLIGGAESPDCVPDTLRAHTDYCRGIYTKHQKSIDEARKITSKKTMACYKLESIKGCLSAGSYFSKCLGANNNEFQDLQGSVMGQMRDLHCAASAAGRSVLVMLVTLAVVYIVRQQY
ncbi:unnamed protein product, partial [Ixodes persulcatus]